MLRKTDIALGFANHQTVIFVRRRGKNDLFHCCDVDKLANFVQHEQLQGLSCRVSLPVMQCRVKTVFLARVSVRELQNMAKQDYFWQESLGIAMHDFLLWWRLLPNREADQTPVLLVAVSKQQVADYVQTISDAGLKVSRQSLACFDLLAATQKSQCHCTVMLDDVAYLIATGRFGIQLQMLNNTDVSHCEDPASIDSLVPELATSMRQLLINKQQAVTENPSEAVTVSVMSALAKPLSQQLIGSLQAFLPEQFSVQAISIEDITRSHTSQTAQSAIAAEQSASVSVTAAAITSLQGMKNKHYPDFSDNALTKREHLVRQFTLAAFGCGSLLFIFSGYIHHDLLNERTFLQSKFMQYNDLSNQHALRLQKLELLHRSQNRYTTLFADIQDFQSKRPIYPQLLEMIETSILPDMSVNKTEFHAPFLFRIWGSALNSQAVVHYVNMLRRYDALPHVVIKSLVTEPSSELKLFTIDCQLTGFTDAAET